MGKPCVTIFVGVESLSDEDLALLPEKARQVHEFEIVDTARVQDQEFELFFEGKPDTSDPGQMVGFGVRVFSEYYDSGRTVSYDPEQTMQQAGTILPAVQRIFQEWGLSVEPQILISLGYSG